MRALTDIVHKFPTSSDSTESVVRNTCSSFHPVASSYNSLRCDTTKEQLNEKTQKDITYRMLDACFEVYKEKGCGFHKSVYQECLAIELHRKQIPYHIERSLPLTYKGQTLRYTYKPDFICDNHVLLEIKAEPRIIPEYRAQMLNCMHATSAKTGLLVNFGHYPRLEYQRIVA